MFEVFEDPREVYTFRYKDERHPEKSWPEEVYWNFARNKTGQDDTLISQMTAEYRLRVSADARRKAKANGKDSETEIIQHMKSGGAIATMVVMSRDWQGIKVPMWATLPDGRPHPDRGKDAKCTEAWILKLPSKVLEQAEQELSDLYEGRSEEDDALFREDAGEGVRPENVAGGVGLALSGATG